MPSNTHPLACNSGQQLEAHVNSKRIGNDIALLSDTRTVSSSLPDTTDLPSCMRKLCTHSEPHERPIPTLNPNPTSPPTAAPAQEQTQLHTRTCLPTHLHCTTAQHSTRTYTHTQSPNEYPPQAHVIYSIHNPFTSTNTNTSSRTHDAATTLEQTHTNQLPPDDTYRRKGHRSNRSRMPFYCSTTAERCLENIFPFTYVTDCFSTVSLFFWFLYPSLSFPLSLSHSLAPFLPPFLSVAIFLSPFLLSFFLPFSSLPPSLPRPSWNPAVAHR